MTSQTWSPFEERALANYIAEQVCFRASGRQGDECHRNYPRDVYFIGNLRPAPSAETEFGDPAPPSWLGELLNKLAPVAFGSEFLLRTSGNDAEVKVKLKWACYYRVFPSYSQQQWHRHSIDRAHSAATDNSRFSRPLPPAASEDESESTLKNHASSDAELTTQDRRNNRQQLDTLAIRYRKISCDATGCIKLGRDQSTNCWTIDDKDFKENVARELGRAQMIAARDPERLRTAGNIDTQVKVPESALGSEQDYAEFVTSLSTDLSLEWRWDIRTYVKAPADTSTNKPVEFKIEFANATQMTDKSPNKEPFIFDPSASFSFVGCEVTPFELEQAPRGFRFDRNLWGRGFNCAVVCGENEEGERFFATTNTPTFEQRRYTTRNNPEAPFNVLAEAPLPVLEQLLNAMRGYLQEWDTCRERYSRNTSDWEALHGSEFDADRQRYVSEIERFEAGVTLLQQNADALLAFQLTNETFRRGPNESWRIFQIVFLVSQIPGIVTLAKSTPEGIEERKCVDIIYFPTGGGKTEAYLGVTIFQCFFDRLRGKTAGVTTWARFPLRLLTVQQMQRFADVVGVAELVRREQHDQRLNGTDIDGFAVGYFVGKEATPNELVKPSPYDSADATWSKAMDSGARQQWKRIMRCPSCGTATVVIDFDSQLVRLIHKCTNTQCSFPDGLLPVYVTDNEIYRYLPSVVVGTIDKLAALGNQRKFSLLLGEVDGRCREHGYFKGRCCQKDCKDPKSLDWTSPAGVSGPSLFVQDELHLLREGLGTFDGHYETFTQRILEEFGQKTPLKIVASSATIEAFERQVEHLYGRDKSYARVFPAPGPTLEASFYAETLDYPQRMYVGTIPHNKTIFNTILELLSYYQQVVQELQSLPDTSANPYGGKLQPGTPPWNALLDLYATSVAYFLAGRELNAIRTDLDAAVNSELQNAGFRPAELLELTGSTTTDSVTEILERLQTPVATADNSDIVLATSMISHGVDIDRLNSIFFSGIPRQNAEYIQASSRVGRSHVGLSFACFHPARERDQSHYSYFVKFHEFLGQLIEPVAINRWSKFSVQRTLPGLFMAVLLQLIANRSRNGNPNRYYMVNVVKQEISRGNIKPEHFTSLLQDAYAGGSSDPATRDLFSDEVDFLVNQFLDQIVSSGGHQTFVSDTLIPRPMRSLREVDEPLDIVLDDAGTKWGRRVARSN